MATTTTAIHEAGHAVAHIRLGIEYGHAHIVPDGKGLLGAACGAGVQNVWNKGEAENMVLAFCAGYAALVAAGYPGDEAIDSVKPMLWAISERSRNRPARTPVAIPARTPITPPISPDKNALPRKTARTCDVRNPIARRIPISSRRYRTFQ